MDVKTVTLAEFLLARLGEDEAAARKAMEHFSTGVWTRDGGSIYAGHPADDVVDWVYNETWEHIARHDPARVLAECGAKRAIVEEHESNDPADAPRPQCGRCGFPIDYPVPWPCPTLRALAAVYSDHADYRQEWRP